MSEYLVVIAILLAAASGVPGLFLSRVGRAGERIAAVSLALAGGCGVAGAMAALWLGVSGPLTASWAVPGGRFAVEVDALSAAFVLPISIVATLGAVYGLEYWAQREHPDNGRKLRAFYGAVTAGMLLQVVARNAILFLAGWEIMALAAFLLVSTEDDKPAVRGAGYVYIVATRLGTLAIFAMFALLAAAGGTLDFDGWPRALASPLRDAIFVLALVGFGMKAGLMPLHVWLPGAHSQAPSHVSAVMSGVLIKMGIYGLVRLTSLCAAPPIWWGHTLLALGVVSAVFGVGFAIGQHDLKRLLAYHSVENIGIICIGLGVAVLGRSRGRAELVALGLAGALLHVWNHALFKSLLFLSAGSVLHATGTREIDRLGGLWRRMPWTGLAFLIGAVAICGLPPLNGLVSELLLYLGLFRAGFTDGGHLWLAGALAAPALALAGALAVACFVKVVGAVFLGSARTPDVAGAHEAGPRMVAPMAALAGGCALIGLGAPLVAPLLQRATVAWMGGAAAPALSGLAPLATVSAASAALLAALALVGWWLAARARRDASRVVTWDCGYAAPSARMQYTASSFAEMLVRQLGWALRPEAHAPRLDAPFPASASFHSHVPDTVLDRGVTPAFAVAGRVFARLRMIQRGSIHAYLLYILGTLVVLLLRI
jgi:hydrogenase-4 component B